MLKSLLLFAHAYPPENLIGARRPERFVRYLPKHGFQPFVLTASAQSHKSEFVRELPFYFGLQEKLFSKTFFPYDDRMSWADPAFRAASGWIKQFPNRPLVFSTSPPLSSHIAAERLAAQNNLVWVADFRDPVVANFNRKTRLGRFADRYIERLVMQRANFVIMNTDAAAADMQARYPRWADKIDFIPNGYDPADGFKPKPIPKRDHKLWLHAGSLYSNRYPERLFDALLRLQQANRFHATWKIRMFGTLQDRTLLERPSVRALVQQDLVSIETEVLPKHEAQEALATADGTFIFDHYHESGTNLAIPAKGFDSVFMGGPVLAFTSPGTPLDRMLRMAGVPSVQIFDEDPTDTIEMKLLDFASKSSEAVTPSLEFEKNYSADSQTTRLALILEKAAQRSEMLRS